jgi:hypothetical protein
MALPLNDVWKSFRDALKEVHNMNMFSLRQDRMKQALEFADSMKAMEDEVGCFGSKIYNVML